MSHHPETNPHFYPQPPHGTTISLQPPPQRRPKKHRPPPQFAPTPHFPIHEPPHYHHPPPNMTGSQFSVEHSPENLAQSQHTPTPHFPLHEPPHHYQPHQQPQSPLTDSTHPTPTRPERNQPVKHHHQEHSPQTPPFLRVPSPTKTKPHTWLIGVFCVLFWLAIILGGLIILVVYLVFRPRGPKFDISNASLNAAYLDMGYLLNADMTILVNFTNPSKKATVDFSHIELYLYYERTLIATSYVDPFSALKAESRLRYIHLVTSQVWLPSRERERLRQQINNNRVRFEIEGLLHTRSNLGTIFRYSYRLYGHCIIEVTGPPSGILVAKQCKTKH